MTVSYKQLFLIIVPAIVLAACNNNGDGNNVSALEQLGSGTAIAESEEIMDPVGLQQNIISLFGPADGEPVPVSSGDTVPSILQRLKQQ